MSVASSSNENLAQLFGSFIQEKEDCPSERNTSEEKSLPGAFRLDSIVSEATDGQRPVNEQPEGIDFPALAMQLLQQAQTQGLFGNETRDKLDSEGIAAEQPPQPSTNCQATNKADSTSYSSGTSNSKSKSGRRSGSKSVLSAATTAALLAPSPLGQLPSIPGAIAVAVSPAAQLFREDDWSWHRNPTASIRSGGTNKQTPVWKYFVYNKSENLSRCIVGNCTYQLKGPHTSTLACHLKKHVAEYAEFQRLKSEYTRERIAAGHGQAGTLDGHGTGSGCSTPTSCQSNGFLGPTPFTPTTMHNGTMNAAQTPVKGRSRSPSLATHLTVGPLHAAKAGNAGNGNGGGSSGGSSLSSVSSPESPANGNNQPSAEGKQTMAALQGPPNGGIFGQNGCLPPPFHQFMMAAALAAAQHQNGVQLPSECRPHSLELFGNGQQQPNGFHHSLQPPHHLVKPALASQEQQQQNGCCGTGANLLDILNLLSRKVAAAQTDPEDKQHFGDDDDFLEQEQQEMMLRRRGRKRAASGSERSQSGNREESAKRRGEEQQQQPSSGGLSHSVEHLLGGTSSSSRVGSTFGSHSASRNPEGQLAMGQAQMDRLALSLGTGLARVELIRLLENPFLRGSWAGLTVERVDKLLESQYKLLKAKMADQLRQAEPASFALMAEICCQRCWNVPTGDNGKCLVKGCDGPAQFFCVLSAILRSRKGGEKSILLLAVCRVSSEVLSDRLGKIFSSLELPMNLPRPSALLIRPQQLASLEFGQFRHCIAAIFPDCLESAFRETLAKDESISRLLDTFHRLLTKFSANEGAQNEWKAVVGHPLTLPTMCPESGHQLLNMLQMVEFILQWREQFMDIASRHLQPEHVGDEATLLEASEWELLTELVHLNGHIRLETRQGEGPNRIRIGQIAEKIECFHSALRNQFSKLGDFAAKFSANLDSQTSGWMHQIDSIVASDAEESTAMAVLDMPCTPPGLAEIFGRNGNGRERAGEEEHWLERSALLIFNCQLLKEWRD